VLLADQRQWVTRREGWCGHQTGDALDRCVLDETEDRRHFLAGEGPNAAADAPRVAPGFFHEERKGRYIISIEYPQIVAPENAAAAAFNRAARDIAFGKDAVAEYRNMEPPRIPGADNSYQVQYRVSYLGPRLAGVVFTISTFAGGAHPNSSRTSLAFDLAQGRGLRLTDLLADPGQAIPAISAVCKAQLEAEAAKQDWKLFDDANFAAVVGDAANWSADKDGVAILFDPYSVAAYYVGPRECRLGYGELAAWLKSDGPLPPR
jgi:peptidoglycan-N-acetylglucosamine deacetylase